MVCAVSTAVYLLFIDKLGRESGVCSHNHKMLAQPSVVVMCTPLQNPSTAIDRGAPLPPLVLSGHAASLTPY